MGVLIKNEFYKLKREWFMVFLLLLSLLPIFTGGDVHAAREAGRTRGIKPVPIAFQGRYQAVGRQ